PVSRPALPALPRFACSRSPKHSSRKRSRRCTRGRRGEVERLRENADRSKIAPSSPCPGGFKNGKRNGAQRADLLGPERGAKRLREVLSLFYQAAQKANLPGVINIVKGHAPKGAGKFCGLRFA